MTTPAPDIRPDPWLTGLFERPVFQVLTAGAPPDHVREQVLTHQAAQASAFYYAKVNTSEVATAHALARARMDVVDVNVTFGIAASEVSVRVAPPGGISLEEAAERDRDALLTIAETSFRYSRFHLDPRIPDALANKIKREWVVSYLARRRGECLWTVRADGQVAGFLAVAGGTEHGLAIRTIDLVAVAPAFQGRGIGQATVRFFLNRYAAECKRLVVGTQIANMASTRLYQRAGMTLDRSTYVMHMHVPESFA